MGQSVYDFSHPCDHVDIKDLFAVSKTDDETCQYRTGFFRMKCTITSKGRSVHLRAASYKVEFILNNFVHLMLHCGDTSAERRT